ncbi:DEAD/DEAH box helicase family protein [Nonomuraea africana]|uniref:Superfamily II DNA or RNA helicase n=1 Tax=Nonomuraea africana TaxID=46171 RepID=A0ABR9KPQ2_9ACTN|nr:superfamily II DNA or RNA helicase [Nonomuraea africana]
MTSLRSYQQELLDTLRRTDRPHVGTVSSATGAGVRRVVALYILEIASTSPVLVLCPTIAMAHQWEELIQDQGDSSVRVMSSTSDALDILEKQASDRAGILIATYARAHHGPSRRALVGHSFGLIVHDQPLRSMPDEISRAIDSLNSKAVQAIALVDSADVSKASLRWPLIWEISPQRLLETGYVPLRFTQVPYAPSAEERELRSEAMDVLRAHANEKGVPFFLLSDSLPAMRQRLLALVSELSENSVLAQRAWSILERMEAVQGEDSRFTALDEVLGRPDVADSRCIVVAATVTDSHYIASHLEDTGRMPRAILSSRSTESDRRAILARLERGECVVATHVVAEYVGDWPTEVTIILWPSSGNRRAINNAFRFTDAWPTTNIFELSEKV